ncbi:unnamed protein product [Anisakis simplex]|uniref:Uncharacterized protein n=1 Tax=Anisakis simplex TaxID=6269 RepID=A0A0M3JKN4_ANISI|nr:unnamed protein product [Anisakis simplex]
MASTSNAVLADSSAPLSPCPRLSCDQRMPSTSTASMDPNRTSGGSNHTVASLSQSSSSKQSDEAWHDESTFKLRRKDLDFEETLAHSPRDGKIIYEYYFR